MKGPAHSLIHSLMPPIFIADLCATVLDPGVRQWCPCLMELLFEGGDEHTHIHTRRHTLWTPKATEKNETR